MTHSSLAARSEPWSDPAVFAALDANAPEQAWDVRDDTCTVRVALRQMTVVLRVLRPARDDGRVIFGVPEVAKDQPPAGEDRAKVLYLHVQSGFLADCIDELRGQASVDETGVVGQADPVVEWLEPALRSAGEIGEAFQGAYADATGLAIVLRLLSMRSGRAQAPAPTRSARSPLPKWRLKRALDYIETHLAEPVTLSDLAAFAGLSRMYFAAQFRAATGIRPHEYLLRRRIERAKDLLSMSGQEVVEVALGVGFQTQAHFTTVFKRFVGETPHRWRCRNRRAV